MAGYVASVLAWVRAELRGDEQFLWFFKSDLLRFHPILLLFDSTKRFFFFRCAWY